MVRVDERIRRIEEAVGQIDEWIGRMNGFGKLV
jgi:hypothetical protein